MDDTDWHSASALLRLSAQLVDGIQDGMVRRGFTDVRPVHGFLFATVSAGPTTATEIASQLQVTKQAAAQLISYLIERGYLTKEASALDRRIQLIDLTPRGHGCTRAAQQSAEECVGAWREQLSRKNFDALVASLDVLAGPGRLRPSW
ncbi:MarR family winged helix-turn-helix transcriptional regulator [Williamsia sp.]|uniref:MarR family winged helix-turn-helix transcriptional regulator n=1 Tax=Williamsia sp. TaxID=1872085 RepID=UPI002F92FC5F